MKSVVPKILSINPGTKETGFALFEDATLTDWGVWTFKNKGRLKHLKRVLLKTIERDKPNILLVEKSYFIQQKLSVKFNTLFNSLKKTAQAKKLTIHELNPKTVRKTLCQDTRATRIRVAHLIVNQYSYLNRYLPRNIKILYLSQKEKYWLRMFDAVALGMAWLRLNTS